MDFYELYEMIDKITEIKFCILKINVIEHTGAQSIDIIEIRDEDGDALSTPSLSASSKSASSRSKPPKSQKVTVIPDMFLSSDQKKKKRLERSGHFEVCSLDVSSSDFFLQVTKNKRLQS